MEKHKILEYRDRLDRALLSTNLTNKESLKSLVKDQLNRSISYQIQDDITEDLLQRRTVEVSNFLEMLQSVSGKGTSKNQSTSNTDWKLKQDNDQLRVMYREGPAGTPFHTLLVEGYVDGPIDICLCVSWEVTLYQKWWPQFTIPAFKIYASSCLQKVRIGEEISLVRVKVPWPISAREAVLHYFELEYFEEDLVVVLFNSIADPCEISMKSHGFTSDGIPQNSDIVRIGVEGGFAIQKVNANRSYFRTIANLDIKVDFVPPALINFISRQLIGSGFKLFQKAVTSVANGDEDYRKALAENPMYVRLRQCLAMSNTCEETVGAPLEGHIQDLICKGENGTATAVDHETLRCEVMEEEQTKSANDLGEKPIKNDLSDSPVVGDYHISKERTFISPDVEWALSVLDRAITLYQEGSVSPSVESLHSEKTANATSSNSSYQNSEVCNNDMRDKQEPESESKPSDEHETSFSFPVFRQDPSVAEVESLKAASTSMKQIFPTPTGTKENELSASWEESINSRNNTEAAPVIDNSSGALDMGADMKTNRTHTPSSNKETKKQKKHKQCCFWFHP